jgi:hypothetical protein
MDTISPEHVTKILELTDSFDLHREAVVIPLGMAEEGGVLPLPDKRLRITVPRNKPFDEWLVELRGTLAKMDLSAFRH